MRVRREEWAKRVERWKDSGLTAKEFAAELGIKPRTLVFWKWQLGKDVRAELKRSPPDRASAAHRTQTEAPAAGGAHGCGDAPHVRA